ncbi:hypothetical protein C8R45DRAFT_1035166 [Mycena sanguinolenta]|nr:hypothetical protein C8R45DRAFT_1035166 [Mycena sanguinolenta]
MAAFHPSSTPSPVPSTQLERPPPLPQFTWDDQYDSLRDMLWPADGGPVEGESLPPALGERIETLTPDDGWLTHSSDCDSDGEGQDLDEGVDDTIRFINLDAHPALAIGLLARELDMHHDKATFAVRHEYDLFMEHAMSRINNPPDDSFRARFFVTGQPGIGKSFGCYYFLFRLLALGQSVFYVTSPTTAYYFSSAGVQRTDETPKNHPATVNALRASWVLIDMDVNGEWVPQTFNRARCVVWTSPPQPSRMNFFVNKFGAEMWYMKAWSSKEIAARRDRLAIDRNKILQRLDVAGPSHEASGAAYLSPRLRQSMTPSRARSTATYSLSDP